MCSQRSTFEKSEGTFTTVTPVHISIKMYAKPLRRLKKSNPAMLKVSLINEVSTEQNGAG